MEVMMDFLRIAGGLFTAGVFAGMGFWLGSYAMWRLFRMTLNHASIDITERN